MKTKTAEKKTAKTPMYHAYSVSDKAEGQKAYWTRVGVCFAHDDGEGGTLLLDAFPVSGRIVLRIPKADEAEAA